MFKACKYYDAYICFIHSLLNNNLKVVGVYYYNPTNVSFEILQ